MVEIWDLIFKSGAAASPSADCIAEMVPLDLNDPYYKLGSANASDSEPEAKKRKGGPAEIDPPRTPFDEIGLCPNRPFQISLNMSSGILHVITAKGKGLGCGWRPRNKSKAQFIDSSQA